MEISMQKIFECLESTVNEKSNPPAMLGRME